MKLADANQKEDPVVKNMQQKFNVENGDDVVVEEMEDSESDTKQEEENADNDVSEEVEDKKSDTRQEEEVDDKKEQGDEVMLEVVIARELFTNIEDVNLGREDEVEEFGEGLVAVEVKNEYKDADREGVDEEMDGDDRNAAVDTAGDDKIEEMEDGEFDTRQEEVVDDEKESCQTFDSRQKEAEDDEEEQDEDVLVNYSDGEVFEELEGIHNEGSVRLEEMGDDEEDEVCNLVGGFGEIKVELQNMEEKLCR